MRMRFGIVCGVIGMLCMFSGCGKAEEYYRKGLASYEAQDYDSALLYYSRAVEENPNKAEYYIEQGHMYVQLGRYAEAREALQSAIVERDLTLTKKNNKRAYRAMGISYYEEGNYSEAKQYFEKALEEALLPELNADIRMYLADALECEGDYVAAIAVYDTLLAEQKNYSAGYRARAYMLYMLGEYEKSLADYDAAIALEPKNFDLYFGKYNVLEKLDKSAEQAELLRVITAIENPSAEDAYFIAKAQYFTGEHEAAIEGLISAAENGYQDAYYYLGEIYHKRSAYSEAVYYYKTYIGGAGAKDAAAYNQMAVCLMKQALYQDAVETIQAGQKLQDVLHGKQLLFNEVVIYERMGDYNTAYEKAADYVRRYPEDEAIQRELKFLSTRVREE